MASTCCTLIGDSFSKALAIKCILDSVMDGELGESESFTDVLKMCYAVCAVWCSVV